MSGGEKAIKDTVYHYKRRNIPRGKRMWTHVLQGFKAPPPPHFLIIIFHFYGFPKLLLPYLARGRSKWKRKKGRELEEGKRD